MENRTSSNMQRLQFFNDSLVYLSVAATKGFEAFKECATLIKNSLHGFPLDVSKELSDIKLDKVSMDLFPTQEFPDLVPVRVSGDGNCLPRSASMLVFGDQQHHVEMRVRIACELALNKDYYLSNESHKMYDFDTFPYCSTITTYSANFKPGMYVSDETIERVFELDTMNTAKRGNYCGIWHLYALSSLVGCRLYSIYPKLKSTVTIRPELNRIIFPRKQMSKRKLAIFWTNTGGIKGESYWSPNHFAPCFPKHFLLEAKQKAVFKRMKTQEETEVPSQPRSMAHSKSLAELHYKIETPSKKTLKIKSTFDNTATPMQKDLSNNTPDKNRVRFKVESKCDLAINFVSKQSKRFHIKTTKSGKNPLKSIFKFFLRHQKDSRGPDVSFYEIE